MSQALYRKWRPARFNEVVGQEHVTRTLQNAVAADRIGHAYLFSGPRGTGKTTIARLVAKAANCLEEDLSRRPCNQCAPCLAVNDGRFLDLIEIDAASNTGVDDIRSLRDKINFAPSEGRFKVYIIDEVHMLSTAAFNALLKTLEEPPAHAIFILATTEEHKVPLTIKSRCQPFSFRLFTIQEIAGRLVWMSEQEKLVIEPAAIDMIASQAAGSLRDAESLLDQLVAAPGDTITLARTQMVLGTASDAAVRQLIDAWLAGDGREGLSIIHQALGSGADARQFARQMVAYLRQLLLLKTGGRDLLLATTAERRNIMIRQAHEADRQQLIESLRRFGEAAAAPSVSWQPQLPLELAFIELLPPGNDDSLLDSVADEEPSVKTQASHDAAAELDEQPLTPIQASDEFYADAAGDEKPISLAVVTERWPKLRELVSKRDKNLPGILASVTPLAVENDILILGFGFPILKEKFDNQKGAKTIVTDALGQLLETECRIRTVVTDDYDSVAAESSIDDEDFAALADELGGIVRSGE
ncbi:MAG TPA: DNA polymerase III subunit gamma/tau [Anaerolineae bacterium]|jgi:DNA polymerase-3 subunit gamma/tau|nr:DNA polymerase III subunit gamma/tau [Anaerolineae bacterium]